MTFKLIIFAKLSRAVINTAVIPGPFMHLKVLGQVAGAAESLGTVLFRAEVCQLFGVSSHVVKEFALACDHGATLIETTFEK